MHVRALAALSCVLLLHPPGSRCQECAFGSFLPQNGTACAPCPGGTYCPTQDSSVPCARGQYCPEGSVEPRPCPGGFFCERPALKILCMAGHICPHGSTAPQMCPEGRFCPDTQVMGVCPPGRFCPEGSTMTWRCPVGAYADGEGFARCAPCPEGTTTRGHESTSPLNCTAVERRTPPEGGLGGLARLGLAGILMAAVLLTQLAASPRCPLLPVASRQKLSV